MYLAGVRFRGGSKDAVLDRLLIGISRISLTGLNFDIWRSRLTAEQFGAICTELWGRIEGGEVHTSSWMPGSDWTGTVFEPIYTRACLHNMDASGRCFGLFLWVVMMHHPEVWGFGRYEKDGIPIEGLTCFHFDNSQNLPPVPQSYLQNMWRLLHDQPTVALPHQPC